MQHFGRSVESLRPVLRHAREKMNDEAIRAEMLEGIARLRLALQQRS